MFAVYRALLQFCTRHSNALRRAQFRVDVDNISVVGALRKGKGKKNVSHALLIQLSTLRVDVCFMLSLRWVAATDNGIAEALSRPSRDQLPA